MARCKPGGVDNTVSVDRRYECQKAFHIGDVGRDAERGAERAAARQAKEFHVLVHRLWAGARGGAQDVPAQLRSGFARARIAEAASADGDSRCRAGPGDVTLVDDVSAGVEKVEGDGSAAVAGVGWPVEANHWLTVAMPQRCETVDEPAGQTHHPQVDLVYPDAVDPR